METRITSENLHDSVLAYARRDTTTLRKEQTVQEALNSLRNQELSERIVYFYVVDDDHRLLGVVPVRRLLSAGLQQRIESIMVNHVVTVPASATVLQACEMFLKHRYLALPIVDETGKLVGVVDVQLFTDEVTELAQKAEVDNAFQLIGVHVALGRMVSSWVSFKDRFPWLLSNIASGIICAFIAGQYELLISEFTILVFFLTVVLALGESVSMQSMTITLQTLLQRDITWSQLWNAVRKEFATACLLGGGSGLTVGLVAFLWRRQGLASFSVGATIGLSIVTACLLGVLIPSAIRALRIDPKVASGPIVLASADIMTLLYYYNLGEFLLL
ncbi:MAG TPA: CBS domain-containing protein [bacterium]|nr:magnesium transporter [Candidatus Omnitrophota bacterium]HOJ61396.1 CBS domain-containing protein [bacterium]HOL95905.1 CBS domain-containing protein [bacterium]HPP01066.1 CBS domain-containing protein [bacterium]HXK92193.1 CBS domain-containing protein [bacterium]